MPKDGPTLNQLVECIRFNFTNFLNIYSVFMTLGIKDLALEGNKIAEKEEIVSANDLYFTKFKF